MRFLKKRSGAKGVISIEQFAEELTEKMHKKPMQLTHSAAKPRRVPSARKKRSPSTRLIGKPWLCLINPSLGGLMGSLRPGGRDNYVG